MPRYKYTDKEIDEIISSMVILVDKREHEGCNDHILEYFDAKKVPYKKKSLKYGDYSFYIPQNERLGILKDWYFDNDIIIERKARLEEIASNLDSGRDRLEKEFALSPKHKVLLIENANYSDVVSGNYNSSYGQKAFWATLHTFWHRYDIPIFFMPDVKYTGVFMKGYFTYYLKEYLR